MAEAYWIDEKESATYTKMLKGKRIARVIIWDNFGPDMCTIVFDDDTALLVPYNHYTPFEDATGDLPVVRERKT